MKQWLETETKKVISDKKKYNRDIQYKKELDHAVLKKIFLMFPLVFIILVANIEHEAFSGWMSRKSQWEVKTDRNVSSLFPNVWTCPRPSCGYSNYDGISSCALCGTARP
ncbi:MAG TPA: hypothetical protein PLC42_07325 [Parachlamydiaceae bacterium]|nr:hypothetical protein [Parachlamydiaceae bacterium]